MAFEVVVLSFCSRSHFGKPDSIPFERLYSILKCVADHTYYRLLIIIFANLYVIGIVVRVMVFNANCNNISVILWQSVLLVEETREPGENHRPVAIY
jgi:hypothetical protein